MVAASKKKPRGGDYDAYRQKQAEISRERSARGRDIGPLPPVADPARREAARTSLRRHCETYRSATFSLGWSPDHLKAIAKIETAVLRPGSLFALAMPRGSGKSSLIEAAAEWALLHGHCHFAFIVGSTKDAAKEMLDSVRTELEANDLYAADFPEVCVPFRRLEGNATRARMQTVNGQRTRIESTATELVLPTVAGSASSGARVRVAGLDGRIRGHKAKTAAGETIRPDLVLADDPQTDESAASPAQTDKRERLLLGAVKGLAGPGRPLSLLAAVTVIEEDDLSDRLLSHARHPQFQGERFKALYSFPSNAELWDRYKELRLESFRAGGKGEPATDFYRANRGPMDAGAVVGWDQRFDPLTELTAVQACMNRWIDAPAAFFAEDQNSPLSADLGAEAKRLSAEAVAARVGGLARGVPPPEATRVTGFIDLSGTVHWFVLVAWDERFGGSVLDYGAWPPQRRAVFEQADAKPSLATLYPKLSEPERVYAGLSELVPQLMTHTFSRPGGADLRVCRLLIDSNWHPLTVARFLRQSEHRDRITPSAGKGRTAAGGVHRWKLRPGHRRGPYWVTMPADDGRGAKLFFDTAHWKTFAYDRLSVPLGGRPAVVLFGRKGDFDHTLIGRHCAAEVGRPDGKDGDRFDNWQFPTPTVRPDNHLWDCLVGSAVAASYDGLRFDPSGSAPKPPPSRKPGPSLAEKVKARLDARDPFGR